MKKSLIAQAVATIVGRRQLHRARTHDVAFTFRMGAGFPGDVNRTHPFSVIPGIPNATTPPRLYGDPVIVDTATNSYRGINSGDTNTFAADGIAVRPYPTQQTSGNMTASFGTGVPATNQPVDVLEDGFIIVKCNVGTPTLKGAVYVYTSTSTGSHVLGGFEAASGSNLTLVSNMVFMGPPDANGYCEARIHAAQGGV